MHNVESGRRLEAVAEPLEAQQANPFRVQAYRRARRVCAVCQSALAEIWHEEGDQGLRAVSGIGERLGTALRTLITRLITTGRLQMLDRLRGETDPVALLESLSGIGPVLPERLYGELGIRFA